MNRLQLHCLPLCQNRSPLSSLPTVPIHWLPQCNRLPVLCRFENFALTSDTIKRIFTHFLQILKISRKKICEFLRILNTEVTNSQSMVVVVVVVVVVVDVNELSGR